MLKWALIFFVISVITGFLGFTGISAATAGIAKILFYVFIALLVLTLIVALAIGQFVFCPLRRGLDRLPLVPLMFSRARRPVR